MAIFETRARDGAVDVDDDARLARARDENIVREASRGFHDDVPRRREGGDATIASTATARTREEIFSQAPARAVRRRRRRRARGRGSTDGSRRLVLEGARDASARETPPSRKTEADSAREMRDEMREMRDEMWAMTLEDEETVGFEFEARLEELWTTYWDAFARGDGGETSASARAAMDAFTKIIGGTSSSALESGVEFMDATDGIESAETGVAERCPVCLERVGWECTRAVRLRACEHVFCVDCIAPWLQRHSTCPTCRANVR